MSSILNGFGSVITKIVVPLLGMIIEILFRILKRLTFMILRSVRWYVPRYGAATVIGLTLLIVGIWGLPGVAAFSSGFNAGDSGTLCGIPGKPPDPTCVTTNSLLRDYIAVQSPNQNALEPLNYAFVREALVAAQAYATWVPSVAGIGMFLFAFGRREHDDTEHPTGFSPETFSWVLGRTITFIVVDIPSQIKAGAKYFIAIVFCLVVVSNTAGVLGSIDMVKNQIVSAENSLLYSSTAQQDSILKAKSLWDSVSYAQAHMPEAYAAQTTDVERQQVVNLAQQIGHGTLPPDQVAAYAAGGYTFTSDPSQGPLIERLTASIHARSLGFVIGLLTTLNRGASGAITWLLLGSLGFMLLPRKWLLAIPAAFMLTAGSQALLALSVSADLAMTTSHGFTSASAALVTFGMALAVPASIAVLFHLRIGRKLAPVSNVQVERLSDFAFPGTVTRTQEQSTAINLRKAA
jgi:hypothetical protein